MYDSYSVQAIEAVCMIEAAKIAQEINTERQEAAAQEIHTRLYNQTPAQYRESA